MESLENKINRLSETIAQEKMSQFTELFQKNLVSFGVPQNLVEDSFRAAQKEFNSNNLSQRIIANVLKGEESRGIDTLGRILVEFCFINPREKTMLWPEHSYQDQAARLHFVEETIPRPLLRYFLVSVRGTLCELDAFHAESMLSDDDANTIDQMKKKAMERLEEFKGPFGEGNSAIDWFKVYADDTFKEMTLTLIRAMRDKLSAIGPEVYLEVLNSYRLLDHKSNDTNSMHRPFSMADVRQLQESLEIAEKSLTTKNE